MMERASELKKAVNLLIENCNLCMNCDKCAVKEWCYRELPGDCSPGSWRTLAEVDK